MPQWIFFLVWTWEGGFDIIEAGNNLEAEHLGTFLLFLMSASIRRHRLALLDAHHHATEQGRQALPRQQAMQDTQTNTTPTKAIQCQKAPHMKRL